MERKKFLKSSLGFLGGSALLIDACKKTTGDDTPSTGSGTTTGTGSSSSSGCNVMPTEEEGPYPYPGGELKNPLERVDITESQTGVPLTLLLTVVNTNNNCVVEEGARVDIWHCNKDGYYLGYSGQPGNLGTKSYVGETWLRGYQLSDAKGLVNFTTIYPGWYGGRATHIHLEIYVNNVLKKQAQLAFSEAVSDVVHVSPLYAAKGVNPLRNSNDSVFGNSATDLTNETLSLAGNTTNGYTGSYTIGLAL